MYLYYHFETTQTQASLNAAQLLKLSVVSAIHISPSSLILIKPLFLSSTDKKWSTHPALKQVEARWTCGKLITDYVLTIVV